MRSFDEIENIAFGDIPKPDTLSVLENEVLIDFCELILSYRQGRISQEQASAQKQLMRKSYQRACQHLLALEKIGAVMASTEWNFGQMKIEEVCDCLIKGMGLVTPNKEYKDVIVCVVDYFDRRIKEG
ncbi:MAG: hypothetical protein PHG19_04730 [Anaerotignum sp.]|nr:hypothetical protein [Anaerotignum sp.]